VPNRFAAATPFVQRGRQLISSLKITSPWVHPAFVIPVNPDAISIEHKGFGDTCGLRMAELMLPLAAVFHEPVSFV
jgi:hypothetical protein